MAEEFDFVIVGAGTAGCVLANRLSADPKNSVAVLEAGGEARHPAIHIPLMAGFVYFLRSINWSYETEPEPHLDGRRIPWPRGKVIGGTSTINGMMYMRGNRRDYDGWRQLGLAGWDYASVLPYFKRAEGHTSRHDDPYHGTDGPMRVSRAQSNNPLYNVFIRSCQEIGIPANDDFNGAVQEGVGRQDFWYHRGRRVNTGHAFLLPVRNRPNLQILKRAHTERILFDGNRAIGVAYRQGGETHEIRARREVIVCGGTINSPALLQLSGIGDPTKLKPLGIDMVAESPDVGHNLQDHGGVYVQYACTQPITLFGLLRPDRAIAACLQAYLFGTGPGTSIALEAGGFARTRDTLEFPDVQITFLPGLTLDTVRKNHGRHGFLTHCYQLRPESRGEIRLASADPHAKPEIYANTLAAEADRTVMRDGVRLARKIMAQSPFALYRGSEIAPGKDAQSDDDIDAWVRGNMTTVWHPVGTCRMGADEKAVVDETLKVRGVDGLRVVDASVMPRITSSNTAAPTIMIAEKAADMILGKSPAAPEDPAQPEG
jgi:choline dehydrogenase